MLGPEMVQLDPAQKQAPAAVEVFDKRQLRLQAKQEVNLLLEQSKNVAELNKGKLGNLQVLGSFTVKAEPGHEAETYDIYRQEISHANELLINEKSSIGLRLMRSEDGKIIIAAGLYEERVPKVAQEVKKVDPLALTAEEWAPMESRIYEVAGAVYPGREFGKLSAYEKLNAIRCAVTPYPPEGVEKGFEYKTSSNSADYAPQTASETLARKSGDCDDLSILFAACVKKLDGDGKLNVNEVKLALIEYYDPKDKAVKAHANVLQIALNDEKLPEKTTIMVDLTFQSSTKDLKLSSEQAVGWNPDMRKKMLEHLNTDRTAAKNQIKEGNLRIQIYGGSSSLEHKYDGISVYYDEKTLAAWFNQELGGAKACAERAETRKTESNLAGAYLEHLAAAEMFDRLIDGLTGRLFSSVVDTGSFVESLNEYVKKDGKRFENPNAFSASVLAAWGELEKPGGQVRAGNLIVRNEEGRLNVYEHDSPVEFGKSSGGYFADVHSWLSDVYYNQCHNLISQSNTMALLGFDFNEYSKTKADGTYARTMWLGIHSEIVQTPGLSAFALANAALDEMNFVRGSHSKAEKLARDAISAAPFRKDGYVALHSVLSADERYPEIKSSFEEYGRTLPPIIRKEDETGPDLKALLDGYVKKAKEKTNAAN